jgi:hypothetical protein
MADQTDNWMTLREAAAYAGYGPEKMAAIIAKIPGATKVEGRGPSGEWRVKASMIDDYFDEKRMGPRK